MSEKVVLYDDSIILAKFTRKLHSTHGESFKCLAYSMVVHGNGKVEGYAIFEYRYNSSSPIYYGYTSYAIWDNYYHEEDRHRGLEFFWGHYRYMNYKDVVKELKAYDTTKNKVTKR